MKNKKVFALLAGATLGLAALSGCAAKALEKELNVVFMCEGEVIDSGVVTQFQNIQSPTIPSTYYSSSERFLGWTCYDLSELDYSDATNFKTQYIGGGRMVHYMDVAKFAENSTVVCNALIMDKDDIPHEYHYAVLAWYDKAANSGLNQAVMDEYTVKMKEWLLAEGVSDEDVNSVVVRAYAGNVGPTTGNILYDDDVDLMLGWGSVSNITTTGSIPEEMIRESVSYTIGTHARYIHRISDSVGGQKLLEHFNTAEMVDFFTTKGV